MNGQAEKTTLLVALGGNALVLPGQKGSAEEQFQNLLVPVRQIARLAGHYRLIITHGNGPQVGNLLLQQESCDQVPKLPLEMLVAQTQGQIGYMIESTLDSELMRLGTRIPLVSLISYVVVDESDRAFKDPTKPIGPFFAEKPDVPYPLRKMERGYRRVVASPDPVTIVEKMEIRRLVDMGFIVICCGGGGIPVIREGRSFHGVDAVIDKDLVSARLAGEVGVEELVIATDVRGAAIDFGREGQRFLGRLPADKARGYLKEGQFPPGSMGPKVEAALRFVEGGGKRAIICATSEVEAALRGKAGTEIITEERSGGAGG